MKLGGLLWEEDPDRKEDTQWAKSGDKVKFVDAHDYAHLGANRCQTCYRNYLAILNQCEVSSNFLQ